MVSINSVRRRGFYKLGCGKEEEEKEKESTDRSHTEKGEYILRRREGWGWERVPLSEAEAGRCHANGE